MRVDLVSAVFMLALAAAPAYASEADLPRVLDGSGGETLRGGRWDSVRNGERLVKGSEVRTPAQGWLLIAFDAAMESVARLGPDSRLAMRGGPGGPVLLEKGKLFMLRERGSPDVFLVATADVRVYVESGGIVAETKKKEGTSVRVYGDRVRVASGAKNTLKDVEEGFEFRSGGSPAIRRMDYADYVEWLAWVKQWYETKDGAEKALLEKEYGI